MDRIERVKEDLLAKIDILDKDVYNNDWCKGKIEGFREVLSSIDSMHEESVSKELEDAAKEYANSLSSKCDKTYVAIDFKAGAKWQHTKSIVDTCYHLEMRLPEYLDYNGTRVERKDFIDDFRKALEED